MLALPLYEKELQRTRGLWTDPGTISSFDPIRIRKCFHSPLVVLQIHVIVGVPISGGERRTLALQRQASDTITD